MTNSIDFLINSFIVFSFHYISSGYLVLKSQGVKLILKSRVLFYVLGFVLAAVLSFVNLYNIYIAQVMLYFGTAIALMLVVHKADMKMLMLCIIMVSLSHVFNFFSSIIFGTLFWFFSISYSEILVNLIISAFELVLSILLMSIKRFRKGLNLIEKDNYLGLGLSLSGIVFIITGVDNSEKRLSDVSFVALMMGIVISGVGLYLWMRRSLTARYREHLQSQSEEHFKEQLKEREKEIEKQRQSNEFLAKVVHRDNHLMNSLNTAIDTYYNADDNAEKSDLFREIQTMIKERGELIDREQCETKLLPSTGSLLIDSTINDLYIKAAAHGIDFDMAASAPVSEIIGKYISQTDLQTLLSDHIKDAVIAVEARGEGSGKILLDLSMQNDNYCITIYDNGVAFEPDTLSKLGMERVTTHAESGGSGIGFMTTFETLNKAYASLIITEFDSTMPFTKSVAFRFDGESSFIIQSHRSVELKEKLTRDDVVIL